MSRPAARAVLAALAVALAAAPPAAGSVRTACDPFGSRACAMPFPNDMNLTVRDATTPTGLRVRLPAAALPRTRDGVAADPAEWNRADGFSPGQLVVVRVPGLTSPRAARRSGLTPVTDLARSRRRGASLVVIDARTRERQLAWAEVDVHDAPVRQRTLLIHPARNLAAGRRYIVVLRNLRTASGRRIAAPRSFRAILRGGGPARYRGRYRGILRTLRRAGIGKRGLYLAWDFTVASRRSTQSRLLHMRDDAFAQLGDDRLGDGVVAGRPPGHDVTGVGDAPGDPRIARHVTGTFEVPCYLDRPGCPVGARLGYASDDPDALPVQQPENVLRARYDCIVPRAALTTPGRLMLHGHGLHGSGERILRGDNVRAMAAEHNFVTCATDWYGLSAADRPQTLRALRDPGEAPAFVDRQLQGLLAQLYLGRLMLHPQGLAASRAFLTDRGRPTMDATALFYDGNSVGGIMGTSLAAIAPDFRRAVLGVPGINFSTLVPRMRSWDDLGRAHADAVPDAGDRALGLALLQMLWDRSEPSGWAANVTRDPPPDTPAKAVLLHVAVGDQQVSTWQADALARTLGDVFARRPAIAPARTLERSPLFGIPTIPAFPFAGSGIVVWDAGADFTGTAPAANVPARRDTDSHYVPRQTPAARRQKSEFLRDGGSLVEVCTPGAPCEGVDAPAP